MKAHVILVHGLWAHPISMGFLERHLCHAGCTTELFQYSGTQASFSQTVSRLVSSIECIQNVPTYLVAHSLGGLIALSAVRTMHLSAQTRVVCLGSPLNGSQTAQRLAQWPAVSWVMGESREILLSGVGHWDEQAAVGVIAGNQCMGLGMLVRGKLSDSDGTVCVDETRLSGISDHCVMPVSHTSMLFSSQVVSEVIHFLEHAHFSRAR